MFNTMLVHLPPKLTILRPVVRINHMADSSIAATQVVRSFVRRLIVSWSMHVTNETCYGTNSFECSCAVSIHQTVVSCGTATITVLSYRSAP
jgi:hypothetical protein